MLGLIWSGCKLFAKVVSGQILSQLTKVPNNYNEYIFKTDNLHVVLLRVYISGKFSAKLLI